MTKHYQKEIDRLKKQVLHLTAVVEERLRAAVTAVTDRDEKLARQVIEGDNDLDMMEVELEEELLKILALHQPVAIDLRFIVAALKINNDLERIGDLAVNIAERAVGLTESRMIPLPLDLNPMLNQVLTMVSKGADSLVNMDVKVAMEVCASDDIVDEMHREVYRAVERQLEQNPKEAGFYLGVVSISRNLERIADHATNIAEDVIYMVEGEIVRHRGRFNGPGQ
jgi:phosphate transport system protein